MKHFLLFLFTLVTSVNYAQNNINNTIIQKAEKVELKGGKAEIINANHITIGTIYMIDNVKPKYYFSKLIQQKDSSGIYITTIELKHLGDMQDIYIDLSLEFDQPVLSVQPHFGNSTSVEKNNSIQFSPNKTLYNYKALVNTSSKFMYFNIKSKTPIYIKMKGIDANAN